jgi:hypothetical protein
VFSPQRCAEGLVLNVAEENTSRARWERFNRWLLADAFPAAAISVVAGYALILQFSTGRIGVPASSIAGQLVGIIVVSGVSSMAIVQIFKSLLRIRGIYQNRQFVRWFTQSQGGNVGYVEFLDAVAAVDSERRKLPYLYDLPIEQLCAQVSAAADVALASPQQFRNFLASLTGGRGLGEKASPDADAEGQIVLSHYVRAGIDQLQISVGHRWRRYVRATAVWLSGLIGIAIVEASHVSNTARGLDILAALLVGGFVAWFTRDVAALVERLRG